MITLKIKLQPLGPFGVEIQSDTLWGHLCWAYRESFGNSALENALKHTPNFIVCSSAFPSGKLPRPNVSPGRFDENVAYKDIKIIKRIKWIESSRLMNIRNNFYRNAFKNELLESLKNNHAPEYKVRYRIRMRNSIDRINGTVKEGALFGQHEYFYGPMQTFDLYAVLPFPELIDQNKLIHLLSVVGQYGYGRDSTAGLGKFKVLKDIEVNPIELQVPQEADHFISLSHGFPNTNEVLRYGTLDTKFGRHGNYLATNVIPYKNPVVRYLPGSVFSTDGRLPYGGTSHRELSRIKKGTLEGAWMVRFFIKYQQEGVVTHAPAL